MFIDLHSPICELVSALGALLLRLPTWDTHPDETQ